MRVRPLLLAGLMLGLLAACSRSQTSSESERPLQKQPGTAQPASIDLPKLVQHNIDYLRRQLGPPMEAADEIVGADPSPAQLKATKGEGWINTFRTQGSTLIVTFNARTRKVNDIVLMGTNEEELMRMGNLSPTASHYIVLSIPEPGQINKVRGVRIIPHQQ
ncbi:hypothetical protein [Hymenobacter sp. BT730]|uniref:hypothetical protein n=1 Tax=Hymenobacter sp. BT730 TaxID=3063332 RepID=UPI0026E0B9B1|nr:hypothetical protein [Hymenobacter sp. BT730]